MQRPLKFVKYLPDVGCQPTVLTVRPEDAAYPDRDETLAAEVPPSVEVERTRSWDPYALYARLLGKEKQDTVSVGLIEGGEIGWKEKIGRWLRANVFLPDARVGWVPFAVRRGQQLLRQERFDAVVTTGPPHSTHLIGLLLGRRTGVPWVADFRDPWTEINYLQQLPVSRVARRIDRFLEHRVLKRASAVTTVSSSLQRLLDGKRSAGAERQVVLIRNGFDREDFTRAQEEADGLGGQGNEDTHFRIVHVGNLTASQNPSGLWKAVAEMQSGEEVQNDGERTPRIRLVGNVDGAVQRDIERHGLGERLDRVPYVPHAAAIRYMQEATLLLLSINQVDEAAGIVPGKIYEYLAAGRPVLGIGPPEGDAARILEESEAGRMFEYDDVEGMQHFLEEHYRAWAAGTPRQGASAEQAAPYSRRRQTGQLAELLDEVGR